MSFFRGIKAKLFLAFLIPVLFIVALGIISYQKASYGIVTNYEKAMQETVDATAKYFNLGFQSIAASANQLSADDNMQDVKQYGSYKNIHKSIIAKLAADQFISNIHIFSKHGVAISTKTGALKEDIFTGFKTSEEGKLLSEATEAMETQDYIWVGKHPYLDSSFKTDSGKYSLSIIQKIKKSSGFSQSGKEVLGYVVVDITPEAVTDTLQSFEWGDGSIAGFITCDGREINSLEEDNMVFTSLPIYKNITEKSLEKGYDYIDYQGESYLFLYSKIESSGSVICGLIPKALITKQADDIRMITMLFVIVASMIAILIGTLMATGIGNATKQMVSAIKKASEGDLTSSIHLRRRDELSYLAEHMNYMLKSMRTLMEKITQVSANVTGSSLEVKESAADFFAKAKEINIAIEEIEKGMEHQAADTESCLGQMNILSDKVNNVNQSTGKIERIAETTKSTSQEGILLIQELSRKSQATTDITHSVIQNIEILDAESQSISDILRVIYDIAEQTNLLSLNASIEAARAGEAGRGFAVVADAVRSLADQSLEASKRIGDILQTIQGRTKTTFLSARTAESIVEQQGETLEKTILVFHEINQGVEHLAATLQGISVEVDEMEQAKNNTMRAMTDISAVVQQTVAATEQINTSANNQLSAVQQLNKTVERLASDTKELDAATLLFRI
ncbi:MAG: methyl-accepting chemotaxis sensory transducer [Herbinix sp.]|nr:methyl-accepting chemotaxis sensory transducer [Herbinix sp.]